MNRRAFERIPSFMNAKVFYNDLLCDTRILNLSQNGIYFITKEYLASGLNIEISIPFETTDVKVPFRIVRISIIDNIYFRFGAKIVSPSQEYIKLIRGRLALMIQNIIR